MEFVDVILFTLLALIGLYYYLTRNDNYWKKRNVEYFEPLPFFGNILECIRMKKSIGEFMLEMHQKAKSSSVVGLFLMDQPCLLIKDPKLIRKILVADFQYFCDRNVIENKRDDPVSAHMLFILKNPYWKEVRSKITPIFTSAKIKGMHALLEESAGDLVGYIKEKCENDDGVIEVRELFSKYTTDVISSTCFGINAQCFKDENAPFRVIARKLFDWHDLKVAIPMRCYFLAPKIVRFFRLKFLPDVCVQFFRNTFIKFLEKRKESKEVRNDMIDTLLEMSEKDPNFDLRGDVLLGQVVMFFGAGLETTSSTLGYIVYELALNPQIQSKLRTEILESYSKYGGFPNDSLTTMGYLDRVVKETLRKYPVLPFLDRQCQKNYKVPESDLVIEKGTPVFISAMGVHYNPEFYPDPDIFNPDRFLEGTNQMFLAFGEGPRNCIGARFGYVITKLAICYVLKNFHIKPCPINTPMKLVYDPNAVVLAPINGLKLKFTKINQ